MALIKIKQKKDPYVVDRMIAEKVKEEWFIAKRNGKLDQVIDIGEWSGPFRKIESVELSNAHVESESADEVLLTESVKSDCCGGRVFGKTNRCEFRCGECSQKCNYKRV